MAKTSKQQTAWDRKQKNPVFVNKTVDKKELGKLIADVYENYGNDTAARLANNLKDLGFKYATKASVTISIEDLTVPPKKKDLIREAEDELAVTTQRFERGEITEVERYNKVIDTWSETNEKVTEAVVEHFDRLNPVYMMAFSGARGSIAQVRQLVGMRGLMADSEGKIIDLPIKSNFKEGLSVPEYMISAYGARKGLVDTALKTADSGYLTRRLVDVAQDVIIRSKDCGTTRYLIMRPLMDGENEVLGIGARIIGRNACETLKHPTTGDVLIKKGDLIKRKEADLIEKAGIKAIKIRSVLTCDSKYGVCKACYGWSTTDNKPVNLGEAIGIIAAQSIGEPGTQLTMRTFHTGGAVAGSGKTRETYQSPAEGEVSYNFDVREIRTKYGDILYLALKGGKLTVGAKSLDIPQGAKISVRPGAKVKQGQYLGDAPEISKKQILTEKASKDVITLQAGLVEFLGFEADEITDRQGNISKQAIKQGTIWVQAGEVLPLPSGSKVIVEKGSHVKKGQILAESIIKCEHDGEVRYATDMLVEKTRVGDRDVKKLSRGRLINVINASIGASNAKVEQTQQGNVWILDDESEKYMIKVVSGELIDNGKILAEIYDDALTPMLPCSGEIRFDGLEIDERKIVTKHGRVIFIPEEIHVLSKDASLVNKRTGDHVTAGTEIVKDVYASIDGIVRVTIDNNIVHEVTITPGELFEVDDLSKLKFEDGDIVKKGVEVVPGVTTKKPSMITLFVDEDSGETKLLLREVQLFDISPREVNFAAETTDENINILPVTQMNFKDGDRVRNINGGALTKTSLILYCKDKYKESKGLVEIIEKDFNIVFQENIILRSDRSTSTITEVLVEPGDMVKASQPVARVQTVASADGEVFYSESDKYRILVQTTHNSFEVKAPKHKLKEGDYVLAGDELDKGVIIEESGRVIAVDGDKVTIRKAQPFLVSAGTRLHADNHSLVQQGDQLATIIYERIKSGDIVQGLPKVEELLEGRKPRDPSVVSDIEGTVEIVSQDGGDSVYIQSKTERKELFIPPGQNIIVVTGDKVQAGDVITDGQPNPHELLEFKGTEHLQQFLVDEVQSVYISQGVEIANKHIEVIVRQMTRKVKIEDPGDTELLQGEMHEKAYVDKINEAVSQENKTPAKYKAVLLGLTKASLNTESFISAASFQETTRILAEAAIKGKVDWLHGLKENIIIGRLIPSGTGFDEEVDSDDALCATDNERAELVQSI
jgi:DNA-directed RNA polymerase subunit beta'